jgi:hypothetical protein
MMLTRQEVLRALVTRFPGADMAQLKEFVDAGYCGTVDKEEFEVMVAAWIELQGYMDSEAVKAG